MWGLADCEPRVQPVEQTCSTSPLLLGGRSFAEHRIPMLAAKLLLAQAVVALPEAREGIATVTQRSTVTRFEDSILLIKPQTDSSTFPEQTQSTLRKQAPVVRLLLTRRVLETAVASTSACRTPRQLSSYLL